MIDNIAYLALDILLLLAVLILSLIPFLLVKLWVLEEDTPSIYDRYYPMRKIKREKKNQKFNK